MTVISSRQLMGKGLKSVQRGVIENPGTIVISGVDTSTANVRIVGLRLSTGTMYTTSAAAMSGVTLTLTNANTLTFDKGGTGVGPGFFLAWEVSDYYKG